VRKGDVIWVAVLAAFFSVLAFPASRAEFVLLTRTHPYLMGFAKVARLATMGELLAVRIGRGEWKAPAGLWMKAVIWGFLGMSFTLTFDVFGGGVLAAAGHGLLPAGGTFVTALVTSAVMNICFAPTMMTFHRVTDTFIELAEGRFGALGRVRLADVTAQIDWSGYLSFVIIRTIPIFWIPAHTITFMLPSEYRVLCSAALSIALGAILSFAKKAARRSD
jgi:hypothetical protein